MADEKYEPTVTEYEDFDPETDAKIIYKACKGFGTDEKAIIRVVAARTSEQLKEVETKYKVSYGKDLIKMLKGELKGNFENAVISRFMSPAQYQAHLIRTAIAGAGTDEKQLIETLLTKTNEEMEAIKEAYQEMFPKKDIEKDIRNDTSGDFERMLISAVQAAREDEEEADEDKAKKEAQELYDAGEGSWGTDEAIFNKILMLRSRTQLRATFACYLKISGRDIEKAIKKELSGNLEKAALTVARWVKNPIKYWAMQIRSSMEGFGTDDDGLIRQIVGRCEIDLGSIKEVYADEYKKTLYKAVKGETSGDYERMLLALIGDD